jgi:glutaminyl-peptide cyclotransferase
MTARRTLLFALLLLTTLLGCAKSNTEGPTASANEAKPTATAEAPPPSAEPAAPAQPAPKVDSARAFQYVKEFVAIGSRPVGSPGHQKAEQFIKSKLAGDNVEVDSFTAKTPAGEFPIHNLLAKFPGKKDGIIVIAGHYETNYPLPKNFVGANDGGSTTGLMLELANQLRSKPNDGYSVWLLFTDGEEAFKTWSETDSLYGTRHLASSAEMA